MLLSGLRDKPVGGGLTCTVCVVAAVRTEGQTPSELFPDGVTRHQEQTTLCQLSNPHLGHRR